MSEKQHLNANIPDLSWLVNLSEADYKKLKERYSDFVRFNFTLLTRELMKSAVVTDLKESRELLVKQLMKELVEDGLLPKSALEKNESTVVT
ncbi:MAG: hypothetical protein M1587_00910 [Thaumarchaeota archaeon]|nr:hypothetical protein [Nitrososphaerota archaeon]MDG6908208.1 hypothetical protein [Nitrososphaerota archaeon]